MKILNERLRLSVLALITLGGCLSTSVNASSVALNTSPVALSKSTLNWGACPVTVADKNVQCGTLRVPENWPASHNKQISVPIVLLKAMAQGTDKLQDPIVFLTGGPGYSAMASIDILAQLPMRETRDIIVMEPRGYGYADPALLCETMDALAACHNKAVTAGIDPNQYTTVALSHDLEALRQQLKLKQWNILGVSYGVFWALTNTRLYGDNVRSMVLDSPYPTNASLGTKNDTLNAFSDLFATCAADNVCNTAYPDLKAKFISSVIDLGKNPEQVGDLKIDGDIAFTSVYGSLYSTDSMPHVPALITAIAKRDYASFQSPKNEAPAAGAFDPAKTNALGLLASVMCADDVPFYSFREEVALKEKWPAKFLKSAKTEGWNFRKMCKDWPVKASAKIMNGPVKSDVPTLILVGRYDPVTPLRLAKMTAKTLPNSTVLALPNAAHAAMTTLDPCMFGAVLTFYADPKAKLDISCATQIGAPKWLPLPDK